jgi:hypothetical protein
MICHVVESLTAERAPAVGGVEQSNPCIFDSKFYYFFARTLGQKCLNTMIIKNNGAAIGEDSV